MIAILQNLNMSGVQHSTLDVLYSDLKKAVAHYLGYKRTESSWDDDQVADILEVIKSGVRQFYFPPTIGGESHSWTFMKPVTTLTTTADDQAQDLPGTFGGIVGHLTYDSDNNYAPVHVTSEGRIRAMQSSSVSSGKPNYCCIRPKAFDHRQPQLFEIEFYPTPDDSYTLAYRYVALTDAPNDSYPFLLGGMTHAETIRLSCLAAAEEQMNDERGEKWTRFMTALDGSISLDRMLAPERLGYGHDRSDGMAFNGSLRDRKGIDDISVTYEGATY